MAKRRTTLAGWLSLRYSDVQMPWHDVWMNMAHMIAMRSRCSRDRVGAVVVSADNQLLSAGYNGAPAGMTTQGFCVDWCPRAQGTVLAEGYVDCYSGHSEMNALLRAVKPLPPGATIYCTSSMCFNCAKLAASSGLARVVMEVKPSHRDRDPDGVTAFLQECGIEVVVIRPGGGGGYRRIFDEANGIGPHNCFFCGHSMPLAEVIHHRDGNHSNDAVDNLVPAHFTCHSSYHTAGAFSESEVPKPRTSITTAWTRRKPILKCDDCELKTTPGWLKRHALMTGHNITAADNWKAVV